MMEPGERETANVEIKEPRLKCPFNFNISPGPGPLSISVRSYFLYFYRRDESGYIIKPRTVLFIFSVNIYVERWRFCSAKRNS